MRLLEDTLKPQLADRGVVVPPGILLDDTVRPDAAPFEAGEIVVKALSGENDRAAAGHIRVVESDASRPVLEEAAGWGHPVWVESAVPHEEELFVGVLWPGDADRPLLLLGRGGSGIEQRDSGEMARLPIDRPVREIVEATDLGTRFGGLTEVAEAAVDLFESLDALSLELNPVVVDSGGRLVALDAKAFVDPYGSVDDAAAAADDGPLIEFTALDGRVGIVSLGAGLTRALIDWLQELGAPAACFCDLIPAVLADAPELLAGREGRHCAEAVAWLCRWLEDRGASVLLVNLVSGGTPIDALSRSVLRGIDDAGWAGSVVAHVGGNRAEAAEAVWAETDHQLASSFDLALRAVASR